MAEEKIIGIDLGTTNSVVAVMEGSEVKVIPNQEGNRLTPSVVAFTDKGERLVGDPAKRQAITNPKRTIYSIKRFMGRRLYEVEDEVRRVPYKVVADGPNDLVKVEVDGKRYTPPEISAMVLRKLKEAAEAYLGHTVRKAVITVPAYFNDAQRQATIDAAAIAGFDTEYEIRGKDGKIIKQRMRIINEPTAACIAYAFDKRKDQKIAVFDLGGGTFDISILDVGEDGVFQVLSTNGDTHLGGDDFDQALMDYVAGEFQKEHGIDLRKDPMAMQRLKEACERAKKDLSQQVQTDINLPFITADASGPKHLMMTITRSQFERLVEHLVERCKKPVMQALADAKLRPDQIDEVVLVGGMTRMPRIQQLVKEIFGKEGHKGVNPDEVVAVGAAIQGAQLLLGAAADIQLLDVTPLTLGIKTLGGVMTPMIPRNTTIPYRKSEIFTTAADNQTSVEVEVYQGERPMADDNKKIGSFHLDGIPPAPARVPKIEVTFELDANGVLSVTAKDLATGKQQSIRIEGSSGLSKEEVERMRREAELHAEEDKRKREFAETKNQAETRIYDLERTLKEVGDKLSESDKAAVHAAIQKVRDAEQRQDLAALKSALHELEQASTAMAQHLYASAGAQTSSGTSGATPSGKKGGGDDVVDAEYEVKK
ncbi:molecular chaperone DnaK [Thermogemmata fonticola]|jgi:molecular chaperone DnaK|uniref:Chaperone protein DnaK n=1 Tax=Thermogemmata fonticola TaxID=2755323 RepID=A0A7V9AAD4_9BACT|nr:molecular chaperone DnaK [Thermogemmata fonticola]MBA2224991.1 molecular chaperone DnaK [Thermogemmata fonticola]